MSKNATNIKVKPRRNESPERLIRRFIRKVKKIDFNSFLHFTILSLMPLYFEKKLFSINYLFNPDKYIRYKILNLYFYLKRILYFYYVLFDTMLFRKKI